jgi:hypothetical protein
MEDLSGRDKIDVERWMRIHHTDPRSKHKVQTLDSLKQTSIIEYCEANVQYVYKPVSLPPGVVSREYKEVDEWDLRDFRRETTHT